MAVTSESGGDIAHGEIVENELDRLIRKGHDRRVAEEWERPERVAWTESERRYDARRRAENRAAWYRCPSCGGAMTPHTAKRGEKRYHYYRCHRGAEYRRGSCKQRMKRAKEAEEAMWGFVSRIMKDPGRILVGMDALIEQKRSEMRGDPERETKAWLDRLAEVEQERRGYFRLAATGRMSEAELDGVLAELEEVRQTAERELDAAGGRREEIEQLERDRDALRASWSAAIPDDLDRLTPEGRNALYHKLRLEMRPKGEGIEVTGPFCALEPLPF